LDSLFVKSVWSDGEWSWGEGNGTDLENLPLIAVGDVVVFDADDLLVGEDPPVFLGRIFLGRPGLPEVWTSLYRRGSLVSLRGVTLVRVDEFCGAERVDVRVFVYV